MLDFDQNLDLQFQKMIQLAEFSLEEYYGMHLRVLSHQASGLECHNFFPSKSFSALNLFLSQLAELSLEEYYGMHLRVLSHQASSLALNLFLS